MAAGISSGRALPERIVLFDGVCGFCHGTVRWLMKRDPTERLHFAPLQGEVAASLRARHREIPEELETLVYVEVDRSGERVFRNSDAAFRIVAQLPGPWRHLAVLRFVPAFLVDALYRLFVRSRYRLFGRYESCPIPRPEERARFLD